MKPTISLLAVIFLFFSCKNKELHSTSDVLSAMSPQEQTSKIDPTVDNVIKGEKGTQIYLPANSLRFQDGTIPKGKVSVKLKEFFSTSNFISNNLSTVSDSLLLETNGMLYISATTEGKELVMDKNMSYVIGFPKIDSAKNMALFYGDSTNGNVNWRMNPQANRLSESWKPDSTLVDSSLYELRVKDCGWRLLNTEADTGMIVYINKNLKLPENLRQEMINTPGYYQVGVYLDKKGKVENVKFAVKFSSDLEKTIGDFVKSSPPFKIPANSDHFLTNKNPLYLCFHREFDKEKYAERFKQKYTQYQDQAMQKMGKSELDLYIFSATKFGWINCDRFLEDKREKVDFIVIAPSVDSKSYIVFQDVNCIMDGNLSNGKFIFKNVPLGAKVKVLGISYSDGKPLLSKTQTVVNHQPYNLPRFKEFNLGQLEKELNTN